jgi:hypothetical protein
VSRDPTEYPKLAAREGGCGESGRPKVSPSDGHQKVASKRKHCYQTRLSYLPERGVYKASNVLTRIVPTSIAVSVARASRVRLLVGESGVYRKGDTGDVAGLVGDEKGHCVADVLWLEQFDRHGVAHR